MLEERPELPILLKHLKPLTWPLVKNQPKPNWYFFWDGKSLLLADAFFGNGSSLGEKGF